ncbi:MAG: hypothetical protein JO343_04295 [Candidatus Eremiobacteraeota bacterium]|nr:hypothetical protein [Candidatus Eremiobacteraeota bacterium]MBV8460988.1 hypothetical protein [Candidatus Eremiobacteraeota bacterium]MBV8668263.1 hypothetical protein [Candidatus Eremiobacteraeota bacterium]
MHRLTPTRLAIVAAFCLMCAAVRSSAAERAVGDQYVYIFKGTSQAPTANMPAMVRAQYEANQAMMNGMFVTLTLHVDAVDPDGSAHATGTAVTTMAPSTNSMVAKSMANMGQDLEAKILPDGGIVPKYDPPTAPTVGESQAQQQAEAAHTKANYAGGLIAHRIDNFNEFALGCSKRSAFKTGDSWRLVDATSSTTWTFAVTGTDHIAGHDVFVITMNSHFASENMTSKRNFTGDYDAVNHLVVAFKGETHQTNTQAGESSFTEDIALQ